MTDVVTVSHISKLEAASRAEALFDRHEVRQGLAGMLQITERIDDRAAGDLRHLGDGLMGIRAQNNQTDPALHVACHIGQRFTFAQRRLRLVDKHSRTAQGIHACLKGEPGAQRCFLEEHHHLASIQRVAVIRRRRLDGMREPHDGSNLRRGKISDGAKVAAGERTPVQL